MDQAWASESIGFPGLSERVAEKKARNEKDPECVQHNIIEEPVSTIVKGLVVENAESEDEFSIGNGVAFDNHPSTTSDIAEEPIERYAGSDFH